MHEKYQSRISCVLNYECVLSSCSMKKQIDMLIIFLEMIQQLPHYHSPLRPLGTSTFPAFAGLLLESGRKRNFSYVLCLLFPIGKLNEGDILKLSPEVRDFCPPIMKCPQKVGQVKHYPVWLISLYFTGLIPFNLDLILLLL